VITPVAHPNQDLPIEALVEASKNIELMRRMTQLFDDLAEDIAQRPGVCRQRGICCQFDARHGHCLYVTALEVCFYLAQRAPLPANSNFCPHLIDGLCSVRDVRPLGCRVYYCDPAAQDWQGPVTETYLARLRALHVEFAVPYFYADWLVVLEALRAHGIVWSEMPTSGTDSVRSLPVRR